MAEGSISIASLDEVFSSNDIVLVDCSIANKVGCIGMGSFLREMYTSRRYDELNQSALLSGFERIEFLHDIISRENAWCISDVAEEVRRLFEILGGKSNYLSFKDKSKRQSRNMRSYDTEKLRVGLKDLQQRAYELYKFFRARDIRWNREIMLDQSNYSAILEMVKLLEEKLRLKRDINYECGWRDTDGSHESDTDEKCVAYLLYLSAFSSKKSALLASDTDFVSLLGVLPRLIGSDAFMPKNQRFRESLVAENPYRLYIRNDEGYGTVIDSSRDIYFEKNFRVNKISDVENSELKGKIGNLWLAIQS